MFVVALDTRAGLIRQATGSTAISFVPSRALTGPDPARLTALLTTYDTDSDSDTLTAIEAGATGHLLKDAPREELFAPVRAAADGRSVLSPAVASRLMTRVRTPAADPAESALSAREREALVLVARGTTDREIAAELLISEATVKTHLTHVLAKLGAEDRAAAVAFGYDRGILG
ncbi:LuxR C-terminal-related transcriptional regulator [Streptomyces globisporus]|uniref:LuxR C-terminal-related transcriptional regulator n=1 Tax=Streptomyces globisporus TaxID=1908 RepID=UPI0038073C73